MKQVFSNRETNYIKPRNGSFQSMKWIMSMKQKAKRLEVGCFANVVMKLKFYRTAIQNNRKKRSLVKISK
ncbi:hypothetical protein M2138_001306 [Dysgonomonadaceae bacterium PH5-43]|nr:hypothetical protein [Dysgonomonadaceae bacterium PH5-43]